MGRVRQRESSPAQAATRLTTQVSTDLSRLLRARSFCLEESQSPLLARLAANLTSFGGSVDAGALPWVGIGASPPGRPSISLGDEPGTLGPRSFGFLNNIDGVAALCAPVGHLPRRGGVGLVVPRRDALPELVPLIERRRIGLSWLISVGDGDPAEAVRFLSVDPKTAGVMVALGRGARATTLHGVLGRKPCVLLDLTTSAGPGREGQLCRAVARRAGVPAVGELEEWLAHGALLDACARPGEAASRRSKVSLLVLGAGADLVAAEAQRARLPASLIHAAEPDEEAEVRRLLAQAQLESDLVVLCGDPEVTSGVVPPCPAVRIDPSQPERLRALLRALAVRPRTAAESRPVVVRPDEKRVGAVLADLPPPLYLGGQSVADEPLSDHDTKRLLHAYGVRVSRQAPASTVTAALRVAGRIGLPVVLVPPSAAAATEERELSCASLTDLKRQATLLLSRNSHIMVREMFPDEPRVRVTLTQERGLGAVVRLCGEAALVPLHRAEARELASALAAQHGLDERGLIEILGQISACGATHPISLDLQIFLADEPVVVAACGILKRSRLGQ